MLRCDFQVLSRTSYVLIMNFQSEWYILLLITSFIFIPKYDLPFVVDRWFDFCSTAQKMEFFLSPKTFAKFQERKRRNKICKRSNGCELWPWWDIFQSFRNILINSMNRMTKRAVSFFPTNSSQLINASIIAQWDLGQSWWCRMEWKNVTNKQREWLISVILGASHTEQPAKKMENSYWAHGNKMTLIWSLV